MRGLIAIFLIAIGGFQISCTLRSEEREFTRAERAADKREFSDAVIHYENVMARGLRTPMAIDSAMRAGRISYYELRKFADAVRFYKHVILYSDNAELRHEAQKKIADLYYAQILNYPQAIVEFNRLLELPHDREEEFNYRLSIARSYFYLSNFYQSQVEIDRIIKEDFSPDQQFDALLLKANIFLTTKRLDDAISVLRELNSRFPERARTETIGLVLAVCYEEKKDYGKAIDTLEELKMSYPKKEFLENRIRSLKERQTLLPGARGLRK